MAWIGYFAYGGNEVVNVSRTEAYVKHSGSTWMRPAFENDSLAFMLGDGREYATPLMDGAPWVDPDVPESLDFYGFYPLDVTGLENSTRTSTVVESVSDGGIPGRLRHATKSVVFNGLLLAGNDAAADYGMQWLKKALDLGPCGPTSASACNGADLCYLSSSPEMEVDPPVGTLALLDGGSFTTSDTPDQIADGEHPFSVATEDLDGGTGGSTFDSEASGGIASGANVAEIQVDIPDLDGGSATALPDMEFSGGTPFDTGGLISGNFFPFNIDAPEAIDPEECLAPYLRTLRKVMINEGPTVTAKRTTSDRSAIWSVTFTAVAGSPYILGREVPVIEGFLDPAVEIPWAMGMVPDDAMIDLDGFIYPEAPCAVDVWDPIFDPLTPVLNEPPGPPNVPLGTYNPPTNWRRRQFTVPKAYVPEWGDVVPRLAVHARTGDLRNLRLRFYSDPFNIGDISDDPCAYCGDIVISWVPQDHTLIMDGTEQTVYVLTPGGNRRRADSLVYKTDGTPFEWPSLSCGFGFIVTLDLPQTQEPPVVDMSLFARTL